MPLVGPKSPEALKVTLLSGESGLDMRTITQCTLHVTRPDGSTATWGTSLSGATPSQVVAQHVFDVDGLEASIAGSYVVQPHITVDGVSRRCQPFKLFFEPFPQP